ncbi:metallophosphoesterase family protein [Desmospora profundinema]|uniref:Phosphoesterase n=1 Tax=Desmospora profundinema TaxID=1571184 RepID=A0ABU1IQ27_9BACL|nr:metallophosphoesterase [Desmospora profundinema]MDR6226821.1 putative phosphoesterase [Desmospora profundinema]
MRVVIISDTHIPKRAKQLPLPLLRALEKPTTAILHAGDWVDPSVFRELARYAPVYGVYGNCDPPEVRRLFGERTTLRIGRHRIGMVHGHGRKGTTLRRVLDAFANDPVDLLIFGHSHMPYRKRHGSMLVFNPGSPTDRRRSPRFSFGVALLGETVRVKHVFFEQRG